jgi:mono/diheme cytochrome c family protein
MMKRMRGYTDVTIVLGAVLWLMPTVSAQDTSVPDKTVQDLAKIAAGENVYNTYCAVCHGDNLVSTGQFPNLRRLTANDRAKFDTTVPNGKNQMPPWKDVLSDAQIDQLWHYIRANGYEK